MVKSWILPAVLITLLIFFLKIFQLFGHQANVYTPSALIVQILHSLIFRTTPTTANRWGPNLSSSQKGTNITINIVPQCELCPRDDGKVVPGTPEIFF